jgi:outer membrane protein assembly factor BamB
VRELGCRHRLSGHHLSSSPAIDSNGIYIVDNRDRLVSVDRESGEINWTKSDFGHPSKTPSVDDNQLFVADRERGVHALTPAGDTIWQSNFPGGGPVAVDSTQVYVADRTRVSALDRVSGKQVWTFNTGPGPWLGSPVAADDMIYVGRGGEFVELDGSSIPRGWIIALDAATGDEQWSFPTRGIPAGEGGPYAGTRSSLAIGEKTLFVSTNAGDLYAIGEA